MPNGITQVRTRVRCQPDMQTTMPNLGLGTAARSWARLPEHPDVCFSATASFTAGAALTAVGGATVHKSRGWAELPIALVPLLFGIQQITEGALWLSLRHNLPLLQTWATYVFSMFSHVLWPILIPFAILLVETSRRRRKAIGVFQVLGLGVGLYLLFFLVRFPVTAHVHGRSIFYESPHFYIVGVLAAYLLATCATGMFSSHRCINAFGALAFVLAIAAYQVSVQTFVSVWCFFAAVLSLLIYAHFSGPMQACRLTMAHEHEAAGRAASPSDRRRSCLISTARHPVLDVAGVRRRAPVGDSTSDEDDRRLSIESPGSR